MKYLISWEAHQGLSFDDAKRSLAVFSKWQPDPSVTFHQFVQRADGRGGYAVVETENGAALLRDAMTFGIWFDFKAEPVIDILDAIVVNQQVVDFIDSVP